jgi:hypothetical protein
MRLSASCFLISLKDAVFIFNILAVNELKKQAVGLKQLNFKMACHCCSTFRQAKP